MAIRKKKMIKKSKAVSLPSRKEPPKENLSDFNVLIYGEPKIGKTSLCSYFPEALFLMTEPGAEALEVYKRNIDTWKDFKDYIKLLKNDKKFNTVIIDTVDNLYNLCFKYMCESVLFIEHPQDEKDYGKSWGEIKKEFKNTITELLKIDKGIIFISHAQEKEINTLTGLSFNKISPALPKQGFEFITAIIDCIFFYSYIGKKRFLFLEGDEYITAGHRLINNFKTKKGAVIKSIYLGNSAEKSFEYLQKAFRNESEKGGRAYAELNKKNPD